MNNNMQAGVRVYVDFVSESSTQFSGNRFSGNGVIDLVDGGYIYGRLDDGTPFMCMESDVMESGDKNSDFIQQMTATEQSNFIYQCISEMNSVYQRSNFVIGGGAMRMLIKLLREKIYSNPLFKGWGEINAGFSCTGRTVIYWDYQSKHREIIIHLPDSKAERIHIASGHAEMVYHIGQVLVEWMNLAMQAQHGYDLKRCKCGVAWDSILYGKACGNCLVSNPNIVKRPEFV